MSHVYDNEHIINTIGLRTASIVERKASHWNDAPDAGQHYWLIEVMYKGQNKSFRYDDEVVARETFNKLIDAIK